MSTPEDTCVITVTYGDRHEYVRDLIDGARRNSVGHVVVVGNGCDHGSRQALKSMAGEGGTNDITFLSLDENKGSAIGFKEALRYVYDHTDYPYVWFLDDDNVPDPTALQSLLHAHRLLKERYRHQAICLLSLREAKRWLWRVANGESSETVFLRRSSFCGFHLASLLPTAWLRKWRYRGKAHSQIGKPISLRFAPYGGLWMPTQLVSEAGYPDERLVLYHDDTEYTSRLVKGGARLFLVPTSRVRDAELSWAQAKQWSHGFARTLLSDADVRVYYNTRNKVYYEIHQRQNSRVVQAVNEVSFWVLLYVLSFLYRAPERRQLIRRAVFDGKRGILGEVLPLAGMKRHHGPS